MNESNFVKSERIWLKDHPTLDESLVCRTIAADPAILGLGDLVLKDRERRQPRAGRLDLLLQDPETYPYRRYEVEIQLGPTDESHIIRTIEYWDIERKRYPQYDHCAVIVAEEITARFLNVIGLFNGMIPLVALQMSAIRIDSNVTLLFTTVLDELKWGLVDEDEEVQSVADRAYWENRGTKVTVAMADQVLELIQSFDSAFELKYNKYYIGLSKNGKTINFAIFRAKKNKLALEVKLQQSSETTQELEQAGLDLMEYNKRWEAYRIGLSKNEIEKHSELLTRLLKRAFEIAES